MGEIVEHFLKDMLEDEQLVLHTRILQHERLEELERKLETGNPMAVARFYKNLPAAMDYEALDEVSEMVGERETDCLTDDDVAVLEFLTDEVERISFKDFLNITGVLVHILDISLELNDDSHSIPRNVEVSALLWVYLNMYELILDTVTQCLKAYYEDEGIRANSLETIHEKLESGEHLMAGPIEDEFVSNEVLEKENRSIFSKERSRFFRNKLGHANIFYDDEADRFTLTSGEQYSFAELKEEYQILYQFLTEWIYRLNDHNSDLTDTTEDLLKEVSQAVRKDFIKIERERVTGAISTS